MDGDQDSRKPGPRVAGLQALLSSPSGCGTWWMVGLERQRGRKAGEKWLNLVLPSIAGFQTPMRVTKRGKGPDPTNQQPALPGGPPPARHTPAGSGCWLGQSPQPCGEVSLQFPPSKAKHQGGKGACPGHTASKWYMDNTAQAFGWQVLGLCVERQRGGVETVANCRAQPV